MILYDDILSSIIKSRWTKRENSQLLYIIDRMENKEISSSWQ